MLVWARDHLGCALWLPQKTALWDVGAVEASLSRESTVAISLQPQFQATQVGDGGRRQAKRDIPQTPVQAAMACLLALLPAFCP